MEFTRNETIRVRDIILEHVNECDNFESLTYYDDPRRLGYILACSCGHDMFFSDRESSMAEGYTIDCRREVSINILKMFANQSHELVEKIKREKVEKIEVAKIEDPILSLDLNTESKPKSHNEISIILDEVDGIDIDDLEKIDIVDELPIITLDL